MKGLPLVLVGLALAGLGACGKKKEITSLERKAAANYVSEAQFAVTLRDFARAEDLYAKAVASCPDSGEYWLSLGSTRVHLGRKEEARKAYEGAVAANAHQVAQDPPDPQAGLAQATALALLGRIDEARALVARLSTQFPASRPVRAYVENKQFERLLADPAFKEVAL